MFQPQGRQADNGTEPGTHKAAENNEHGPEMGDNDMGIAKGSAKGCHCIGTNPHKGGMPDGNKACKSRDKVKSHDGHNGNENIVHYEHILVAQLKKQRPGKKN